MPANWSLSVNNLVMIQELRAALFAIRCFNVETGLVGETVKETGLLPIRMQWWKDAVNSMYRDKPVKHPAVQGLAHVSVQSTVGLGSSFSKTFPHIHRKKT